MNKVFDGRVLNLATGEYLYYSSSLHPKEAVIAAYAQDKMKDFNTWNYHKLYVDLVQESCNCYTIGDYSVFKEMSTS